MKNLNYILDIGSSKISLIACCIKNSKSIIVTAVTESYDGFMDEEFFSNEQVYSVISNLLSQMSDRIGKPVEKVYVGIPSEFSACVCKRVTRNFVPAQRITDDVVAGLFDGINDFSQKEQYIVVSYSPLQYDLDGNVVAQLTNKRISKFVMDCSYVLVKKNFADLMQQILNSCDVKQVEFVSTALAQAQFAIKQQSSSLKPIIIVDVGHITTSVSVAKGDGLMMVSAFALGGGHITADLMQVNNLTYAEADIIKRKVGLTIQSKRDERYVAYNGTKPIKALINITNDIVKARIENIANVVNKILSSNESFANLPIYLTGDGVCNYRGVVNLFEAVTNHKTYILKSPLHNGEDKYQTSKIGLVNIIGDLV